jgi:hypothetical protein
MPNQKIAVLFVHGIEIHDPEVVDKPMQLLRDRFTEISGRPADQVLAIRPVLWGEEMHRRQEAMFQRCLGPGAASFSREMTTLVEGVNAGSQIDLLKFLWRSPLPAPELGGLRFPALRWFFAHFGGDVVAYQIMGSRPYALRPGPRAAGRRPSRTRRRKPGRAQGPALRHRAQSRHGCRQQLFLRPAEQRKPPNPDEAADSDRICDNPLEKGETLTLFYTLGSPLALWASSYIDTAGDMGRPITVPAPELPTHHPKLADVGGWENFVDPDDIIGYPLAPLGGDYQKQVTDRFIDVGPVPSGVTPLSHISYWYDRKVIDPIAERLVQAVETNV